MMLTLLSILLVLLIATIRFALNRYLEYKRPKEKVKKRMMRHSPILMNTIPKARRKFITTSKYKKRFV